MGSSGKLKVGEDLRRPHISKPVVKARRVVWLLLAEHAPSYSLTRQGPTGSCREQITGVRDRSAPTRRRDHPPARERAALLATCCRSPTSRPWSACAHHQSTTKKQIKAEQDKRNALARCPTDKDRVTAM